MEETQSFRLTGTTEIVKIPIQHVDGQTVVHWESIEQIFPGVKGVKVGDVAIPCYIKYFPGEILDVVLSSATEHAYADSAVEAPSVIPAGALDYDLAGSRIDAAADLTADHSSEDEFVEDLQVTSAIAKTPIGDIGTRSSSNCHSALPRRSPFKVETPSKPALYFMQVVKLASKKANESDGQVRQQELSAQMAHMIKLQEASDAKQEKMNQLQKQALDQQEEMKQLALKHQEEMKQLALDHHEEMKQMQQRALDQLSVLQSRVQAVLTQTYELHEYPIPRLFVVLPQDASGWDIVSPFSNKFRLYFLCECGEHTKSINSKTKIPHHIHLAKHEGYEIVRPSEFFQQYAPYVLTILKMLRFGVTVAGVAMPAFSQLISPDVLGQTIDGLKQLQDTIVPGVDQVINWMDKATADDCEGIEGVTGQVDDKKALEGADLRKLETFLKDKDGNKVLGNLYRTVTDEGHVKWVCMDHYRENYNRTAAEAFRRAVDSLEGSFDENNGLVKVKLGSRGSANQFYLALEKARSVHEFHITLDWVCTGTDVKALENALKKSMVSILRLDLQNFQPSLSNKLSSLPTRYEILCRITKPPNMKSIHIVLPKDIIKLSNFTPRRPPHLRKLSFEMVVGQHDLRIYTEALKTGSNPITLYLRDNSTRVDGAKALAEALKTSSALTTLNLSENSIGDDGAKALADALKTNSTLTGLYLQNNSIGDDGAKALAEALKTNSALTTLNLESNSIGDDGAKALAEALKTNSMVTIYGVSGYNR